MSELQEAARQETNAQRNTNGQFKAGNKGGPGNPNAAKTAMLRQAVLDCITCEDLHAIVRSMLKMAIEGNWQAAKLLLAYVVGKPGALPDPGFYEAPCEPAYFNAPSANGVSSAASSNVMPEPPTDGISEQPPSANGVFEAPPLPNGVFEAPPSANGVFEAPPLPNGDSRKPLNRQQRRALRKAYRLAKSKGNTPTPVTIPSANVVTSSA